MPRLDFPRVSAETLNPDPKLVGMLWSETGEEPGLKCTCEAWPALCEL